MLVIMRDYRQLMVWQKAHSLTLSIYTATKLFPREEVFGLTSQLRRAAVSIPSNIAEGAGRQSSADFARFLDMAVASCNEVEYQIFLASELEFLPPEQYRVLNENVAEIRHMLTRLAQKMRTP